jgi:hypothetical protein
MLPSGFTFIILALAAYRLTRLAGWDTFPLAQAARRVFVGVADIGDPQKPKRLWAYDLIICPFCLGWWISLLVYSAWLTAPTVTMYGSLPLALSAVVGLVSKNLDP